MTDTRYEGPVLDDQDHEEKIPVEAEGMAGLVLFAAAVALIVIAPFATKLPPAGKPWYLAPINWPLASLGMAAIAGAILAWRFVAAWRASNDPGFGRRALWALGAFRGAFEYSAYFCLYLVGVAFAGFALATFAFLQFVVWRAGLRGRRWVLTALAATIAIVVIFRLGIGLWFPLPPLFKLLPSSIGNHLAQVL